VPETVYNVAVNWKVAGDPGPQMDKAGASATRAGVQMDRAFGGIGGQLGRATEVLGRFSPSLATTAMEAGGAASALGNLAAFGLNPIGLASMAAVGSIGAVVHQMKELTTAAIEYRAETETATRQVGAALSASYQFGKEGTTAAENLGRSMAMASRLIGTLQEQERQLGEDMPVLAEGYRMLVPGAEKAAASTEEIMQMLRATTLAAKAFGMESRSAYAEVQAFMATGMARGELMKQIGLAGEKFGQMAPRARFDVAMKAMGELGDAGMAAAQTTGTQWKMHLDDVKDAMGEAGASMADSHRKSVNQMIEDWDRNKDAAKASWKAVADTGAWFMDSFRKDWSWIKNAFYDLSKLNPWVAANITMSEMQARAAALQEQVEKGTIKGGEAAATLVREFDRAKITERGVTGFRERESERGRLIGQLIAAKPMEPAKVKMDAHFYGNITLQQMFQDQDPDRVAVAVRRDLSRQAERRTQSAFAPTFGF
jgi:hypothetical protein